MHSIHSVLENLPKEVYLEIVSKLSQDSLVDTRTGKTEEQSKVYVENPNLDCVSLARCSKICYEKFEQFPKVWELTGLMSHRFSIGHTLGSKSIQDWTTIAGMCTGGIAALIPGIYLASLKKEEEQNSKVELSFPKSAKKAKQDGMAFVVFPLFGMALGGMTGSKVGSYEVSKKMSGIVVGTYFSVVAIKTWGSDIALPKICRMFFG